MQSDLFPDIDPADENVDDVHASVADLRNAVLYNTDWTVETVVNQIKKGRIDLSPAFQRRDAWTLKAKSLLIESVLLNFPIPQITLAEKPDDKTFIVVDGKQRLTAISQFVGGLEKTKDNNFTLCGLNQLSHLNGKDFKSLCDNYPRESMSLENYSIRTNVIRGWKNDDILYSIFHRLNSGSVKLSAQELRQSLHPGHFSTFINDYSERSVALRDIFSGEEPDFRMRDVELATRYLSLVFFIDKYSGNLKNHLDITVNLFNDNWKRYERDVTIALERFEQSYRASVAVFTRDHVFKKWNDDGWSNRTNRAIFDSVMFNLTSDDVLDAFNTRSDEMLRAFQSASIIPDFRDAVERTTKTTGALFNRINILSDKFTEIGVMTPKLLLVDNHIAVA